MTTLEMLRMLIKEPDPGKEIVVDSRQGERLRAVVGKMHDSDQRAVLMLARREREEGE